jgi:hypothetical protein
MALLLAASIKAAFPDDPPVPGAPILLALGLRSSQFIALLRGIAWLEALAGGCLVMNLWVRWVSAACAVGYGLAIIAKIYLLGNLELLKSCGCLGRLSREMPVGFTLGIDVVVLVMAATCALASRAVATHRREVRLAPRATS